jgi:hypothetical protein
MNNTHQVVKLDLSGLQTETSMDQYRQYTTSKLNELLYNEYPIHSGGGGFGSLISKVGKNLGEKVGNSLLTQGANIGKTALKQGSNIRSSLFTKGAAMGKQIARGVMDDINDSTTSIGDVFPSKRASPKQSFSSNRKSSQETPSRNQSFSNQRPPQQTPPRNQSFSSNQRPSQQTPSPDRNRQYSPTSEEEPEPEPEQDVDRLKKELGDLNEQIKELDMHKQELDMHKEKIIDRIIGSKYYNKF